MIETSTTDFGRGAARWHSLASSGEDFHFSPANGLPFRTYASFLDHLADKFTICGLDNRGAWPGQALPEPTFDWNDHAADLIAFLEHRYDKPVIGAGHSIGATVSLIAASQRPDLFRALALIEPATLPSRILAIAMRYLPAYFPNRLPLVRKTRTRRATWGSHQQFIDYHRTRRAYGNFTDAALTDYAEGGLAPGEEGQLRLVFPPAWEAHNFSKAIYIWDLLARVEVPTFVFPGAHTDMYSPRILERQSRRFSASVTLRVLEGVGHLAPQHKPEYVAGALVQSLRDGGY